jgi:hypothetical protein
VGHAATPAVVFVADHVAVRAATCTTTFAFARMLTVCPLPAM